MFRIVKEVDKDSKEAKKALGQSGSSDSPTTSSLKRPGGLSGIMDVISGKKKKMGCLDKSKLDWNKFVEKEGIKEELVTHNRGKDG